nr:cohesin domain-containing protein [Desulfobacteraceae bacterium]
MILRQVYIFGMITVIFFSVAAIAETVKTKLYIPELEVTSGQAIPVPVKIDPADKLAGIKLVLEYDPNLFRFEKVEKTKQSAGLMHVVNDQKPGHLIIVMAGARGITGKDITILFIHFTALPDVSETHIGKINITEIELMTDSLKEIPCALSNSSITV